MNLVNPVNVHRLLLATRNRNKTREFAETLGKDFDLRDITSSLDLPSVAETGVTFEENAILKAVELSKVFPDLIVADDSGLEVDVLNGAPGIYSARYAGENATDRENIAKLLSELAKCPDGPCTARFRCVLAIACSGTLLKTFEGAVEGTIVTVPKGQAGFGYDPIFQPAGFSKTFAEFSPAEKNLISHRGRAIQQLREYLLEMDGIGETRSSI